MRARKGFTLIELMLVVIDIVNFNVLWGNV